MIGPLRIGIMGAGEWGPNLLRAFMGRDDCRVVWVCDSDPARLAWLRPRFPGIDAIEEEGDALHRPDTDAVAICTPTESHFRLCHSALASGKHVFVEKPMARTYAEARQLVALAEQTHRKLMVGHVFLFHPGILAVKRLLDEGVLGQPVYVSSIRSHFGPVRDDVSVMWDLAPHDLAVLRLWFPDMPVSVQATGLSFGGSPGPDSAQGQLRWESGLTAHLQMSWIEPRKVRRMMLLGTRRGVVFEENESGYSVRMFEPHGRVAPSALGVMAYRESLRGAGQGIPVQGGEEPVGIECGAFVDWIRREVPQFSSGNLGAEVVFLLECLQHSLNRAGERVVLPTSPWRGGTA